MLAQLWIFPIVTISMLWGGIFRDQMISILEGKRKQPDTHVC